MRFRHCVKVTKGSCDENDPKHVSAGIAKVAKTISNREAEEREFFGSEGRLVVYLSKHV